MLKFFWVVLFCVVSVKGSQVLHLMKEVDEGDGDSSWGDLAGRRILNCESQTTTLGQEDQLNYVIPIKIGKDIIVKRIYEYGAPPLAVNDLIWIIEHDAGLRDYERKCHGSVCNMGVRKQIANFIQCHKYQIKKICNDIKREHKVAYSILKFDFFYKIGKVTIEEIKTAIEKRILSLYEASEEHVAKLKKRLSELEKRTSELKNKTDQDQIVYEDNKNFYKKLQWWKYGLFAVAVLTSLVIDMDRGNGKYSWVGMAGAACLGAELGLIIIVLSEVSYLKKRMASLQDKIQGQQKELKEQEEELQNIQASRAYKN